MIFVGFLIEKNYPSLKCFSFPTHTRKAGEDEAAAKKNQHNSWQNRKFEKIPRIRIADRTDCAEFGSVDLEKNK